MIRCLMSALGAMAMTATLAVAQTGGPAAITTGASFSNQSGAMAFIGFDGTDLFGSGIDIHLSYEAGAEDHTGSYRIDKNWDLGSTALGQNSFVFASLDGLSSEISAQQFARQRSTFELGVGARTAEGLRYSLTSFFQSDALTISDPLVSPLVAADQGRSTAGGLILGAGYTTMTGGPLPSDGFRIGADLAYALPVGDREWMALSVNAGLAQPVGPAILTIRGEAGRIQGRNGDTVSILDRAFLGHDAPRGFAFGGLGPRDITPDAVNTTLGGNRYFSGSVEMRFEVPNSAVSVGAFLDAGAVWDLDVATGGASGVIDDGFHLRTAAGISGYWQTSIGMVQINLARPIQSQTYDEPEYLSIGLGVNF